MMKFTPFFFVGVSTMMYVALIFAALCAVLARREGKLSDEAFISGSKFGTAEWRIEHNWHHDEVRRLLIDGDRNKAKEVKASQAEYWKHAHRRMWYLTAGVLVFAFAVFLIII